MSSRVFANIGQVDILRRHISIYVGTESESGYSLRQADGTTKFFQANEADTYTQPTLTLRDDEAKELLQALMHYYDGGEDTRSLRKDYDAERARVDKMLGALLDKS